MRRYSQINKFYHGIMFHHFHDTKKHSKFQGSINEKKFLSIIKYIGRDNIIDADIFIEKLKNNNLKKNHVCLTFDDGLKSQFDIALPILKKYKIKAFFFVYSSIFDNEPDLLEIYRYFRVVNYKNVDDFYNDFFSYLNFDFNFFFNRKKKLIQQTKLRYPFYSYNDIKFRIIRDHKINQTEYDKIMKKMFFKKKFDFKKIIKNIYLTKKNIKSLYKDGHIIGLHTHSHPTKLDKLISTDQYTEYSKNIYKLKQILGNKSIYESMSHPNGSYNKYTLSILGKLNLKIGFKSNTLIEKEKQMTKINNSNFEIAREDHSNIVNYMNEK